MPREVRKLHHTLTNKIYILIVMPTVDYLLCICFYSILKSHEFEEMFEHGEQNETTSLISGLKKKKKKYILRWFQLELQNSGDVLICWKCERTRPSPQRGKTILHLQAISSYGV